MFVVILADAGYGVQVVAYQLAQDACPCPVQDAYAGCTDLYGIVDKVGHRLQCFVSPHTSNIDLLLKVQFLFVHIVGCLDTDKGAFLDFLLDLAFADLFQLIQFDGAFDHAEGYDSVCLAVP